ncbi:GIY-YIG nuclease family protein [Pedobacter cryophilus]|jgi:putative endonuclease|uniref:GIY-YIG nuclease family protein n=1 Tax=Pedobacter cryophilus TaxID=2571271 RepID=A0A4U1C172_9SPHI|nr:GIY-YIG nuclease family protein [Pedobacter cryophilus]TKB97840.1 GIY-YIG nuclease family protein [Pedobacter cryophilus]
MKKFVFIVTDRNRNNLHVGLSTNIISTMDFYRKMPNLFFDAGQQLTRLVYFEELNSEANAEQRFKTINRFTRSQKEKMIRAVNTDWIDLTLGLNYENRAKVSMVRQSSLMFMS